MKSPKVDLILHPVRMRVIRTLVGGRHLTAQQIGELLEDVPQATLYRHINTLVKGKVLTVVEENQIRGAVEKVYALVDMSGSLSPEDLAHATPDEHMEFFMTFVSSLIQDYHRYLQRDDIDLVRDGVGYRQIPLFLTDAEFNQMLGEMNAVLTKYYGGPEEGRVRRMLTTVVIPD